MKSILLTTLLLLTATITRAQFSDNFDDGNIDDWGGDISSFIANGTGQLQLMGDCDSGDTNYISSAVATHDSAVWEFFVDLDFDPSAANHARIYLQSNNADLIGLLNGYFVKIGEDGSGDVVHVCRQDGLTVVPVCDGITNVAVSPTLGIKVVRTEAAVWELYLDPAGGTSYVFESAATDATYNGGDYFGIYCKYTSSRCDEFYFDNVFVDPLYVDVDAPFISALNFISPTELEVDFNEDVDEASAETASNYSVDGGVGAPVNATLNAVDQSKVLLTFASAFPEAVTLTLTVNDVADQNGNPLITDSETFSYYTPDQYDVVINEIFADIEPVVNFPLPEFVEIYNTAPVEINLEGWVIADAAADSDPFPAYNLPAGGYVILCDENDADELAAFPNVLALPGFPGLNNDGDFLMLLDPDGNFIHTADYSLDWYDNTAKEEGGWSLEMIDPLNPCQSDDNWTASTSDNGFTPGEENSVYASNPDETSPAVLSAYPVTTDSLIVYFDEPVEVNSLNTTDFTVDNGIGNPTEIIMAIIYPQQVKLVFATTFNPGIIYTLTVEGVTDCSGNEIGVIQTVQFGLPESPDTLDIVINEVLFNPYSGGVDFVELYNRSNKIIDISKLVIAELNVVEPDVVDESSQLAPQGRLLFPASYLVLSESTSNITTQYGVNDMGNFIEPPDMPGYGDNEGIVALYDQTLHVLDQFHYYDDWHYDLLTDVNGVSLERVSYERGTENQNNWHSAAADVGYATPGYQNSVFGDIHINGDISFEYNVFSPDGDGYHDLFIISYSTAADGFTGNFKIFDAQGRIVKELMNNELLSREGFITWDGVDDDGKASKMGIHILYAELFNLQGQSETYKMKFTLVKKQ